MIGSVNVLVASHSYPSSLSQLDGSFVHNQARFLQRHCSVRVVSPTRWFPLPGFGRWSTYRNLPQRESIDGIEVLRPRYRTYPKRWRLTSVWKSYRRALQKALDGGIRPDLIHAHYAYPDGYAAVQLGRILRVPVVVTVHGHDLKDLAVSHAGLRRLVAEALLGAATVIAVSVDLAERAAALGVPEERIRVIPNGVDMDLFCVPAPDSMGDTVPGAVAGAVAKADREGKVWTLLYVGRFDPAKGIGVLIEATSKLQASGKQVRAVLVGGSPATGTADPFRDQAAALGIAEQIDFVDEVAWHDMPRYMQAADIFVLPSFSEGMPLVMLEALASGLPVVSTRCGGPTEVIDERLGRLVEVGSVDELVTAIAHVIDHYGDFDREEIRRRAVERFDYRNIATRIASVYEEVSVSRERSPA